MLKLKVESHHGFQKKEPNSQFKNYKPPHCLAKASLDENFYE